MIRTMFWRWLVVSAVLAVMFSAVACGDTKQPIPLPTKPITTLEETP